MSSIKLTFNELKKSPIIKNLAILVSGTGIAQLLPIISAPIVARLYEPEDFGTYAIFYSLLILCSGFIFLDYHNAIIIAPNNQKAVGAMALCGLISLTLNSLILCVAIFLPPSILSSVFGDNILPFIYIIPITTFINSLNTIYYTWFLRQQSYKFLSKNKIILASCSVCLQIGIGLLKIGSLGFIIANLASSLVALFPMLFFFQKHYKNYFQMIDKKSLKEIVVQYKRFPLVSVWGNTLNIFTLQIPDLLLNKLFGSYVLGQYFIAQRMISLPMSFISSSIQDVFRQSASEESVLTGQFIKSYKTTFRLLSLIAIVIFISCLTFVPSLFTFVFGSKWSESGDYVRVLAILFVVRFVAAPLSYSFYIREKQHIDLFWQVGLFILSVGVFYIGYTWASINNPIELLFIYSIVVTCWYVFNIYVSNKISKLQRH